MDAYVRTSKHFPRNCSFRGIQSVNMPVLPGQTSKPYHIPDVTKLVTSMDNEQLTIQRAIQGDEAAMRSLWTRHAPHIDAVVRRLVGEDTASVETDPDRSFMMATIETAASKLSPGARAVFLLHDVEGFTHEEIAERLGITSGGSKSQLFKARAKLRTLLAHLVDVPMRKDVENVAPVF